MPVVCLPYDGAQPSCEQLRWDNVGNTLDCKAGSAITARNNIRLQYNFHGRTTGK